MYFEAEVLRFPDGRLAGVFLFLYEFFVVLLSFFPPVCIAYSVLTKRSRLAAALVCVLSVPVIYAAMTVENSVIDSRSVSAADLAEMGLGWLSVIVCYLLVYAASAFVGAKSKKAPREIELFSLKGLLSRGACTAVLVTALFSAAQRAVETAVIVKQLGAPDYFSEVLELVTPYVIILVGGFAAYVIGCSAITKWEGLHTAREHRK